MYESVVLYIEELKKGYARTRIDEISYRYTLRENKQTNKQTLSWLILMQQVLNLFEIRYIIWCSEKHTKFETRRIRALQQGVQQ